MPRPPSPAAPAAARRRPAARPASRAHGRKAAAASDSASAESRVYSAIRDAILDHRLRPGTKLTEADLCSLFGVSRAVVRNALARLGHARLADLRPNRGAVVATPTQAEARELFDARRAIEAAIVRRLARNVSAAQLRALRAETRRESRAYAQGDLRSALRLSIDFHRHLAAAAGNGVLAEFLDFLLARTPLVVLTHNGGAEPRYCGNDEHLELLDAISAGDSERAEKIMQRHIDHLQSQLLLNAKGMPALTLAQAILPG